MKTVKILVSTFLLGILITSCTKDDISDILEGKNDSNLKAKEAFNLNDQTLLVRGFDYPAFHHELYTFNIGTKEYKQLTHYGLVHWTEMASLSPDGQRLAFSKHSRGSWHGDAQLYVVNLDGTGLKQLTFDHRAITSLKWHPNGRSLFYSFYEWRDDGNGGEFYYTAICQHDIDETVSSIVIDNEMKSLGKFPTDFAVSPHGNKILVSMSFEDNQDIYEINTQSLKYKKLTIGMKYGDHYGEYAPKYFNKGNLIAFKVFADDWNEDLIVIMNKSGENQQWASNFFDAREITEYVISGDDKYLAYCRKDNSGNSGTIYVVDLENNTEVVKEDLSDGFYSGLHFMADNKHIAHYHVLNQRRTVHLFMLDVDGKMNQLSDQDLVQGGSIYGSAASSTASQWIQP
jgi:Tol biopolymer transport system component